MKKPHLLWVILLWGAWHNLPGVGRGGWRWVPKISFQKPPTAIPRVKNIFPKAVREREPPISSNPPCPQHVRFLPEKKPTLGLGEKEKLSLQFACAQNWLWDAVDGFFHLWGRA